MWQIRDAPTNDLERARERLIKSNEEFCLEIGLGPGNPVLARGSASVKEKRKVDAEQASSEPTREKSSRVKFLPLSGNDEYSLLKTMIMCDKCPNWNTGMQFPQDAAKALLTHQQSDLCIAQHKERLLPVAFQSCEVVSSAKRK